MRTIVFRALGTEQGRVILELECGHHTTVPLEDELALSFVGSEFDCDRHWKRDAAPTFEPRVKVLAGIWTDATQINRLVYVAASRDQGKGWLSEYTTREERCRSLNQ